MTDTIIQDEAINKNIKALNSDNPLILKDTLVNIRENGNNAYIPVLVDLLLKYKETENADIIRSFIADIKSTYLKEVMITALKDKKYESIHKELTSVCWESAVDFGEHISFFVDMIIGGEFNSAFEALTVIENLESKVEVNTIKEDVDKLKSTISTADEARKYLIYETINILEARIA